jgi:hypothetical protein
MGAGTSAPTMAPPSAVHGDQSSSRVPSLLHGRELHPLQWTPRAHPMGASPAPRQPAGSLVSSPWPPCSLIHGAQKIPAGSPFFFLQPAARPPLSHGISPCEQRAFSVVFNLRSLPSPCSTLSIFFTQPIPSTVQGAGAISHGRAAPLQRASPFPQRCAAPPR